MHHIPEPKRIESSNYSWDPQRKIDFKKYLQDQEIAKAKMERRNSKQMLLNVDMASFTRSKEEYFFEDEDMSLEEDYFEEDESNESTWRFVRNLVDNRYDLLFTNMRIRMVIFVLKSWNIDS